MAYVRLVRPPDVQFTAKAVPAERVIVRLTLSYPTAVVHATVQRTGPPMEQTLANAPTDTRTPVRPVMCVAPTEPDARRIATAVPAPRATRMPIL